MTRPEPQHSPEELADMFDVEREDIYKAMSDDNVPFREEGDGNYYLPLFRFVSDALPNIPRAIKPESEHGRDPRVRSMDYYDRKAEIARVGEQAYRAAEAKRTEEATTFIDTDDKHWYRK